MENESRASVFCNLRGSFSFCAILGEGERGREERGVLRGEKKKQNEKARGLVAKIANQVMEKGQIFGSLMMGVWGRVHERAGSPSGEVKTGGAITASGGWGRGAVGKQKTGRSQKSIGGRRNFTMKFPESRLGGSGTGEKNEEEGVLFLDRLCHSLWSGDGWRWKQRRI